MPNGTGMDCRDRARRSGNERATIEEWNTILLDIGIIGSDGIRIG